MKIDIFLDKDTKRVKKVEIKVIIDDFSFKENKL